MFECILVDKAPFYFRLKKKIEPTVTTCFGRTMSQRSNNILHGRKSMLSLHYRRPFNIGIVVTGPQDSLKLHIIIFSMSGYYNANALKVSLDGILLTLKNNAYMTTDTLNAHF